MKKCLLAIIACLCLVFAFTACGDGGSSGFDVPFEKGTTDAAQITTNAGDVEEITAKELDKLQESNGAKFDTDYKHGEVLGVGIVSEIKGAHGWNGYDMEAAVRLENGWYVEAASPDMVKDFEVGDVVAFKGKLSGVWDEEGLIFGKDESAPQIQLFAEAGSEDAVAKDDASAGEGSSAVDAEYYAELAKLPTLDCVVDSASDLGSSQSSSSGTSGTNFFVEYRYELDAASADEAKDLLKQYCDFLSENGFETEQSDSDSYTIMSEGTKLATIDFEDEDGSYYAEMELVEVDQSYKDQKLEELEEGFDED